MPLKMKIKVFPKRQENSPIPGGDIVEDIVDSSTEALALR
jgi:hypothetical protein